MKRWGALIAIPIAVLVMAASHNGDPKTQNDRVDPPAEAKTRPPPVAPAEPASSVAPQSDSKSETLYATRQLGNDCSTKKHCPRHYTCKVIGTGGWCVFKSQSDACAHHR